MHGRMLRRAREAPVKEGVNLKNRQGVLAVRAVSPRASQKFSSNLRTLTLERGQRSKRRGAAQSNPAPSVHAQTEARLGGHPGSVTQLVGAADPSVNQRSVLGALPVSARREPIGWLRRRRDRPAVLR